jgi:peptide deformylase
MAVREVLLLGNPTLYEISKPVTEPELNQIAELVTDLHDTLMAFRERHGAGRAIAAPQIGAMKRLVYMYIHEPMVFINPVLDRKTEEMMEVWDDCLCFPELLVKVRRHKGCRITCCIASNRRPLIRLEKPETVPGERECPLTWNFRLRANWLSASKLLRLRTRRSWEMDPRPQYQAFTSQHQQ